jgi:carnitine 3-dehydrogenase
VPLALYEAPVEPDWVDYNGHMSEWAFLTAFGWASDKLFRYIGIDEKYRAAGYSLFTVETHLNYVKEASLGDPLRFTTQILGVDAKRLHLFHAMRHAGTGELLCTTEQMLLHVDTGTGSTAPVLPGPASALAAIAAVHADLPVPPQVGRVMGLT